MTYPVPQGQPVLQLGKTAYPADFEDFFVTYKQLLIDLNNGIAGALTESGRTNGAAFWEYINDFLAALDESVSAPVDPSNPTADPGYYDFKILIPKILNGTLMDGGGDIDGFNENGFFIAAHAKIADGNNDLATSITVAATDLGIAEQDVTLFLQYDNPTGGFKWVYGVGINKPAGATTDQALAKWDGVAGDALKNTGVIISDSDEMSGQGVKIVDPGGSITLNTGHRGQVLGYTTGSSATITCPDDGTTGMTGFQCTVISRGNGTITITKSGTSTLEFKSTGTNPPTMDGQHSAVTIIKVSEGPAVWGVYGDLSVV